MSHVHLLNTHVLSLLPKQLSNMTILDVGCGYGEWGFLIRTRKSGFPYIIGMDIWHPHLKKLSHIKIYNELIRVKIPEVPLKDKSVDITLACEILEHLNKNDGYKLLKELERVSRKLIIISCPLDYPQDEIYGNPYERHITEWKPDVFKRRGYKVIVIDISQLPKPFKILRKIKRVIFRQPEPKLVLAYKHLKSSLTFVSL
ncbi:MAG: class I SAM-dependent methyltransferase [Nitrososphaeria archaeon]